MHLFNYISTQETKIKIMQKEQKPAPSAKEATDAILKALKITNPPAEAILIEMYLENDLPLVVKYNVASLGTIKLCLSNLPSNS